MGLPRAITWEKCSQIVISEKQILSELTSLKFTLPFTMQSHTHNHTVFGINSPYSRVLFQILENTDFRLEKDS